MTTHSVLVKVITVYCLESSETNTCSGDNAACHVMQLEHIHLVTYVLYLGFNKFYVRISSYCKVTAV